MERNPGDDERMSDLAGCLCLPPLLWPPPPPIYAAPIGSLPPSLPPSVHLSQDDEQVPGRHGAVAAAAAATAEDAVADDDDDDDSGWIRWPSDAGLEAFEATDLFQLCCEFGLGIYLPT